MRQGVRWGSVAWSPFPLLFFTYYAAHLHLSTKHFTPCWSVRNHKDDLHSFSCLITLPPHSHRRELLADVCVCWDATHWAHLINAKWTADPTWPTNQSLFLGDLWLAGRDWTADPTWPIRALPRRPVVGRKRLDS